MIQAIITSDPVGTCRVGRCFGKPFRAIGYHDQMVTKDHCVVLMKDGRVQVMRKGNVAKYLEGER